MIQITDIQVKTITKNNGDKEYLIWATDNLKRDWRIGISFTSGFTELQLGLPHSYQTVDDKEERLETIRGYIERKNIEFKRHYDLSIKSEEIETISI